MKIEQVKSVGIIGAGTMGLGIAQVAAQTNFEVILFDIDSSITAKALTQIDKNLFRAVELGKLETSEKKNILRRIKISNDIQDVKVNLVIEAVVEKLEVKKSIFQKLEEINSVSTILSTNTSSIPVTRIGSTLKHPERFVGMHFFNPAHIMKLVEVISGAATAPEIAQTVVEIAKKMGKVPVLAKDSPGFIVNRVARHYYVESLKLLEDGVCDFETLDKLMEASGFKMGPFRLMDLIGVDTNFSVTSAMFESFHYDAKFRPSRIQQQKVDAGHWGKKTGKGFYNY